MLEERIREMAAKGNLTHISVYFSGGQWRAVCTPADRSGQGHGSHKSDPVAAIESAIDNIPSKRRQPKPAKEAEPWE